MLANGAFVGVRSYRPCISSEDTLVYISELVGTPHREQYKLMIRFADGTEASLPLPENALKKLW